jgi:thioredoxin-dependent peroxiredoxin
VVQAGEAAPDFVLPDASGHPVSLSDFRGRVVVLYFYPRDFTLVCTREGCAFRDEYASFTGEGAVVIGVSADAPESHARFTERHGLPFLLLSDADGAARRLYGVRSFLGLLPGRVTFVIDAEGTVLRRFESQYQGRRHVEEALAAVRDLTAAHSRS